MNKQKIELVLGIVFIVISLTLGIREIKNWNNLEKNDFILQSFGVKKIGSIIGLFLVAVYMIYRICS